MERLSRKAGQQERTVLREVGQEERAVSREEGGSGFR